MEHIGAAWVRRLAVVVLLGLGGLAVGQSLDVLEPSRTGDGCTQTIMLPSAMSRSGAVAVLANYDRANPDRVVVTVALRYSRALFGVEEFLKFEIPNVVQLVVELEGARMRFGPAGGGATVEIVDLSYLRRTGTEYVSFAMPLETFVSLARAPRATFGRIDTNRAYVEFNLSASFFEALGDGFVRECVGTMDAGAAGVAGSAGTGSYRVMTSVSVNIDVLRVRDTPGLSGNLVARAERGLSGDVLDPVHRDADGFRWWHVQFHNGVRGWVADGDDDLDYLVRGRDGTRLTPFAPVPALAPIADRVFAAANVASVSCPTWVDPYVALACGAGAEAYPGSWASVADPMIEAIDAFMFANDFTVYFEWDFGGGAYGLRLSAFFSDGVQVLAVTILERNPVVLLLHQYYP